MDPLIVTVAAVGAELTLEEQPFLPVTPDDLADDARACEEAGASIYHLHVRDASGSPTMSVGAFREAMSAIRSASDLIVQLTTGGAVSNSEKERVEPLDLRPEMATLTTGSVNFGKEVFLNPWPLVERFYVRMRSLGILPEFEIFDAGMIATAVTLVGKHGDDHPLHFDFVLGVPGAMPAWADSIDFLVAHLPAGATWSATGIGNSHHSVAERAIKLGGHVRTGFEDLHRVSDRRAATSNGELVQAVADMAAGLGRRLATPSQTRRMFRIEGGRETPTL